MEPSTSYARKSPRIRCQVPVQIRRERSDAADDAPLFAHTIDVSSGGMRLDLPVWMGVGEPLVCELTLDGEGAALRGHVAWSSASGTSTGLGVAFAELSAHDARRLDGLVRASTPGAEPIELRFEGLPAPIRARAITKPGGIRLATALPVLTRDAGVVFRYGTRPETYAGHVADVTVREREGARILEVDVHVAPRDQRRFRKHARYGVVPYAAEIPRLTARQRVKTGLMWRPSPPPRRPEGVTPVPDIAPAVPASAEAVSVPSHAPVTSAAPNESRTTQAPQSPARVATFTAIAIGTVVLFGLGARRLTSPESQPTPTHAAVVGTAAVEAPPVPSPAPRAPDAVALASAPDAVALETATPPPALAGILRVRERATGVEVSLPFEGSLEQLAVTRWVSPKAWVLVFPMARTPLPDGRYELGAAGLPSLRVTRTAEGLSLRFDTGALQSPRLNQQQDQLTVTFRSER